MNKKILEESTELNLQFKKRGGLLPVIVQDTDTERILMLGYANEEAFEKTINSKLATFWSTSRNELWTKGKTSGDYMNVQEILIDCDQDAVVYRVKLAGDGVCHTKDESGQTRTACFYRTLDLETKKLKKN